ncbi:MAG TPA: hypothetical protein VMF90_12205 [Rhizobiaceae bacterium]|nr:hypothetical protein [Rhizobiaceae bacterium]
MEQITYGSVDPQVAKANAHLIAAAPDMLAALKGIVAEDAVDVFDSLRPEWQAVVLAIAKAEGRAS